MPVALNEVPETGRHLDLVADAHARAAIAKLAGLAALPRLAASFDVTLHGRDGLHVVGEVSATVHQTCVVTLEPIENEVDEPIDLDLRARRWQRRREASAIATAGRERRRDRSPGR